jgi:squalene-hopene/tetraprenyl-beta-curcumene cyclase
MNQKVWKWGLLGLILMDPRPLEFCLSAAEVASTVAKTPMGTKETSAVDLKSQLKDSINQAVHYLRKSQKEGAWLKHPGVTALCLQAIFGCYRGYDEKDGPWIRQPVEYLLSCQQSDGSFYDAKSRAPAKNYCTALAILALTATNNPAYKENIARAQQFLIEIQCDEGESYSRDKDYAYGGIGYGGDERPDLSNLQLALEALKASGLPSDHPAFKKAMVFIQRCHDVEGNEMEWAGSSGGFAYSPDLPSNKNLPTDKSGGAVVVPYGSMTFAGLKSLIFCDVDKEDPRVREALQWVGANFSVAEHPNMGQASIYYYYQTMAKALQVAGINEIPRADGTVINWRQELATELIKRQAEDGHWVNENKKYMEGMPDLCTAYALNALNIVMEGM